LEAIGAREHTVLLLSIVEKLLKSAVSIRLDGDGDRKAESTFKTSSPVMTPDLRERTSVAPMLIKWIWLAEVLAEQAGGNISEKFKAFEDDVIRNSKC
jgi:hypothetical protein